LSNTFPVQKIRKAPKPHLFSGSIIDHMGACVVLKLFPPQEEVIKSGMLDRKEHCFICMPPGTGKTRLAEYAMEKVIASGFKAVYVTPLRALAAQQYERFRSRFPGAGVGLFTGETVRRPAGRGGYSSSQVLIMTPERLDACMRNWRGHWSWIPDVDLIVIDEFHILGQPRRGPRLEGTITRFIRLNPFARIVGLSATMPNADELARWLHGASFSSPWRQVPLEKKITRFKAAKQKPELLLEEVARCAASGGQSLIFCGSRSRAQAAASYLNEHGIPSACHHAGLGGGKRAEIENAFKTGAVKALAATSTLEMGLNLPARQVVIYDSRTFTEAGFAPLPVWSFIQRAGRAGRPGLDARGEMVLMLPCWDGGAGKYLRGECENVDSLLTSRKAMQEQLLIEVFAGYSRTREELARGFLPMTLYKKQHPEASVSAAVDRLVLSGLLTETGGPENAAEKRTLHCGLPGRLAVKLMLAPETVRLVRDAYANFDRLYLFDLLLLAAVSEDCGPVLPVNYEELDALCETVQRSQSVLLDLTAAQLREKLPDAPDAARVLTGIKMAAVCRGLTEGMDPDALAEKFDAFAADIHMLRESMIRILSGAAAIALAVDRAEGGAERAADREKDISRVPRLSAMLADMLRYGIGSGPAALTRLKGVGGKTAKRLAGAGFETPQSVAGAGPAELAAVPGIGKRRAAAIIKQAAELLRDGPGLIYREEPRGPAGGTKPAKAAADPYRLRRSLELSVQGSDGPRHRVSGGREEHIVVAKSGGFTCDCMDFRENGGNCKHILCVRRSLHDPEVRRMVRELKADKDRSIRESLPNLWYAVMKPPER